MSMSNSATFIEPPLSSDDADEIDSLPSSSTVSSADDSEYVSDADKEWRESLQQMELLLTMVVVPYIGKYFGRKCAYWGAFTVDVDDVMELTSAGWAKWMEWNYPVEVVITSPGTHRMAGAIEAAASL